MTPPGPPDLVRACPADRLRAFWADLNARYFRNVLPPIEIGWSDRLTASAGMFSSRSGPRCPDPAGRRCIRLSVPLLHDQPEAELLGTLAHEMIHQWQFDVLKRRPNHGPDFLRKMAEMNRDGLGITVRHSLDEAVAKLAAYAWRCLACGQVYRRQRRTIRPSRHRCGACLGTLAEVRPAQARRLRATGKGSGLALQLDLPLAFA
ncbi:MAG: SprT-like domain-containing protein [Nitrospirota bacterium]